MKQAIKRKWITALRSGKYEQGQGGLVGRDGAGFCCLGVLACVVDPTNATAWRGQAYLGYKQEELTGPLGKIGRREAYIQLANLNDGMKTGRQKSFNYLASYIERFL